MAVLVEALSVIVRHSTLRDKYPGGVDAYREHCPNGSFCADEHVARIGFMVPDDVKGFVERLEERGLVGIRDGDAIDLVIIDQFHGPTTRCSWIEGGGRTLMATRGRGSRARSPVISTCPQAGPSGSRSE